MTQLLAASLLVFASFALGWIVRDRWYVDPCPDHDPNKPFTAAELHRLGIRPPESYDCWLRSK